MPDPRSLISAVVGAIVVLTVAAPAIAQPRVTREEVVVVDRSDFRRDRTIQAKLQAAEEVLSSPYGRTSQDFEDAKRLLDDAIAVAPMHPDTYFKVASIYLTYYGDYAIAHQYLDQFFDLAEPTHERLADAHLLVGQVEWGEFRNATGSPAAADHAERAERHLLAAYDTFIDEGRSYAMGTIEPWLADLASFRGDGEAAVRYCRAALDHGSPDWFELTLRIAYHLVALDRAEEAQHVLSELTDMSNASIGFNGARPMVMALAHVQRALGNYEAALQYLLLLEAQYLDMQRLDPGAFYNAELALVSDSIATTYFEMGEYEEAEVRYRRGYELEPGNPMHMNNLAWVLAVRGTHGGSSLDEALALAEEAVRLDPRPAYLDTLAEVYARLGRNAEALALLEAALEERPTWIYLERQRERVLGQQSGFPITVGGFAPRHRWEPPKDSPEM